MATLIDILDAIECSQDVMSVMEEVRGAALPLGYDRILMVSFSSVRDHLVGSIYWVEGEWFDEGQIDAETFARHCPVTHHVLETDGPFFWSREQTTPGWRYSFGAGSQGAALNGLQVPVFSHNGLAGAVCFGGDKIETGWRSRLSLTHLGTRAFLVVRNLLETAPLEGEMSLSARELEVLRWIASGQRVAEVAYTLGLSERTVENHLRRIRHRLQVKTTAQAVGYALRSGALRS